MSLLAKAARRGGVSACGWTRAWLAPSRVAVGAAVVEMDVASARDLVNRQHFRVNNVPNVVAAASTRALSHAATHAATRPFSTTAIAATASPPPSPSRAKEVPAASQPPMHDEAAELRAVAQLKAEISEVLHARGRSTWIITTLIDAYQSHFGKDFEQTRRGGRRGMADPLVLSWMVRRDIFHTVSKGGGRKRMKVHGIVPLLRSEHFADVVDVYPRGNGGASCLSPQGPPCPCRCLFTRMSLRVGSTRFQAGSARSWSLCCRRRLHSERSGSCCSPRQRVTTPRRGCTSLIQLTHSLKAPGFNP
jgi:hypothetical protein